MEFQVHQTENNPASQVHLDENRARFNKKCGQVYSWLLEGREITVLWAANNGVSSLPRRCLDLKKNGVFISDKWERGVKVYFMSQEDKEYNKQFFATN